MYQKRILILFVALFWQLAAFAQQIKLEGHIKDESGMPIIGASVIEKGTTRGVSSDFDGNFQLEVTKGATIEVSYIGFATHSFLANTSKVVITLKEEAQRIEEVVIIGYGVAKKKDVTGSVNLVSEKDFNKGRNFSASSMLQGKVAGVEITSSGGAPGEGQSIRIRGTGSLSLTSNPLVVVDGVPMNDSTIGGERNILNAINPEDIESMTVLKDASSTAIYGSRAANGVIMITTKKGKAGQKTNIELNSSMSVGQITDYVDVLSASELRDLVGKINPSALNRLGNADTNWQKEIYQIAPMTNTTLGISGNLKTLPYRFSLGHTYADGNIKTDNFQRGTAKLSLTPRFFDDKLKTEFNISGSYIKNRFADKNAINNAVEYDPSQPVFSGIAKYDGYHTWLEPSSGTLNNNASRNPLTLLRLRNDVSAVKQFISNLKLDYSILPNLIATANIGYDYSLSKGTKAADKKMPSTSPDFDGTKEEYKNTATNGLFDFYLNYMNDFGKHNISVMAGHSYQKFGLDVDSVNDEYFVNKKTISTPTIDRSRSVLVSFFGRLNYSFAEKYLLTATLRADASSKLNPNDRWGYFPSMALAWNVKKENFLVKNQAINELKLRIGYGEVGNVNGLGDYLFLTRYVESVNQGASYQLENDFYKTLRPEVLNQNLKWEIGNTANIGIDYGFFNNRFYGSVDAYIKRTKNLIAEGNVAPFTNFGSRVASNIGDMENKGIEALFNVVPVQNDDFQWVISYNIAYNDNKITRLNNIQNVGGITGGTGNTIQLHKEGYAPYSFFLLKQKYDAQGKPIEGAYEDKDGDGVITNDDRFLEKSPYADITMGLSTNVRYKNWDLNIASRASLGNYVYDNISSYGAAQDRMTIDAIIRNVPRTYFDAPFVSRTENSLKSDVYLHDASFFKIDNVVLGYNFPATKYGVRLYGSIQNVATFSKYHGLDPEIAGGIDYNMYPRPRIYSVGINVKF